MLSNEGAVRAFRDGMNGSSRHIFHDDYNRLYSYGHHFILAVRLANGTYLINGDTYSSSTSTHTSICIQTLKPNVIIPFSALRQVAEDVRQIKLIERNDDQYVDRLRKDPTTGEMVKYTEHRLGSAVFEHGGKHYLSSIDTGAKRNRGYFLVELPEPASSVDEAFDLLFPVGLDKSLPYIRQGEFFFVPTDMATKNLTPVPKDQNDLTKHFPGAGTGHAHTATELRQLDGKYYARETVRHPEHKTTRLGKIWHEVYCNRAVKSFNAVGNVD